MPKTPAFAPSWDTSSFGHPADTSPMEYSALADHMSQCSRSRGRFQALRTGASVLGSVITARLVTTALVIASIAGALWLVS